MTSPSLVRVVHGAAGVVQAGNVVIDPTFNAPVNFYGQEAQAVADYVRDFDLNVDGGFVGREEIFTAIDEFAGASSRGYIEIVGEAGLGKTALAMEIARRRDAIAFLASEAAGVRSAAEFLTHACASLIVRHELGPRSLPASAATDPAYLITLMRQAAERTGSPIWVVVDALDEAERPSSGANPLLLPPNLPGNVYIVVTRRDGVLITAPGLPVRRLVLDRGSPRQTEDVTRLVHARLGPQADPVLVGRLTQAADGNFMYLSYLLGDMAVDGSLDFGRLPSGLKGYYQQFWERMSAIRDTDWPLWSTLYEPVAERLAVAFEAVTAVWLGDQVGRPPNEIRDRVLRPWRRLLNQGTRDGAPTWRTVHKTFGEYLREELDLRGAHRRIAERYLSSPPYAGWDDYGMRHAASHLAQAALRDGHADHDAVVRLVETVTNQEYVAAHLDRFGDPGLLQSGLDQAHRLSAKDDHPDATFLLVSVVLAAIQLRRGEVRGELVLAAADRGDMADAERLLEYLSGDLSPEWLEGIRAIIAWIAREASPADVPGIVQRVEASAVFGGAAGSAADPFSAHAILARLVGRLLGSGSGDGFAGDPRFAGPVDQGDAEVIMARLSGGTATSLMVGELLAPDEEYLSQADGPMLVRLAVDDPEAGERLMRRYTDIHRAYGYRTYRDQSLWWLLDSVLHHPDEGWSLRWARELAEVVLAAPVRGEFLQALDIAALAILARSGDGAALAEFDGLIAHAAAEARDLPPHPLRGEGDTWSLLRRRLAALAEAAVRVTERFADGARLTSAALGIEGGFAGFTAPAALTLAETAAITLPGSPHLIHAQLDRADVAAQNIQDPTFCIRMTARVRALRNWWAPAQAGGPGEPGLRAVVESLFQDPSEPAFGALHLVGAHCDRRAPQGVRLPDEVWQADTLARLAGLYRRPVEEFARFNPQVGLDQSLPPGAEVRVPDPGFPPLVAARLSAAVTTTIPDRDQGALLRHLMPATGPDITARCTVLARLLLSAPHGDLDLLREMRRLTSSIVT